jgi:hypothetical protein
MGVRGETGGLGSRAAGPAARGPPRHLAGRPRGIGELTAIVGGSRRCPPSASLEDVGEGPRRTNRASQSPDPGTDSPERNRRAKPRTAARRKSPRRTRGVQDPEWQHRLPPAHAGPSLWVGPGKAGLKRGRSQAGLGPRCLPRTLLAGAGGAGRTTALGATPPRPGRCPGGGPAGRSGPVGSVPVGPARASGLSAPWCRVDPPGEQGAGRSGH